MFVFLIKILCSLVRCCYVHDMCYDNLSTNKDVCGKRFDINLLYITPYFRSGCTGCGKCFFLKKLHLIETTGDLLKIVGLQQQQQQQQKQYQFICQFYRDGIE